ncbi:MAG: ribosome-associated protein [Gammaproteobacteria bacterium]|nr:ribosome-associated protein [Gammaproteobacteria bacterium]
MINNHPELPTEDDNDEEIILISKSQLKRESHALTDLGKKLVELSRSKLSKIPLEEDLAEAIALAQRIKERGGRKRQLQYVGKLLRNADAEPIIAALEKLEIEHAQENARLHRLEQWRERLLHEGDNALGELLANNPGLDRQQLRQLLRNAHKEQEQNKPPKSARELFKYLRDHIEK